MAKRKKTGKRRRREKVGWYIESAPDHKGRTHLEVRNGIPDATMEAFSEALDKVRAAFFEEDEDGDFPVRIHISDRTTHGPNHYLELWHSHKGGPERVIENLQIAAGNCRQAGDEMRRVSFEVQDLVKQTLKRVGRGDETQGVRVDEDPSPGPVADH
jgi:hypothetical protein